MNWKSTVMTGLFVLMASQAPALECTQSLAPKPNYELVFGWYKKNALESMFQEIQPSNPHYSQAISDIYSEGEKPLVRDVLTQNLELLKGYAAKNKELNEACTDHIRFYESLQEKPDTNQNRILEALIEGLVESKNTSIEHNNRHMAQIFHRIGNYAKARALLLASDYK
ncbi:MAG: hypothetical protein ACQESG_06760 [Nanobdellota archaeon]